MKAGRRHGFSSRGAVGARVAVTLGLVLTTGGVASGRVVIAPWSANTALVSSKSVAGGVEDVAVKSVPGPSGWGDMVFSNADNDTTDASAWAVMSMGTSFADSLFAVTSSGSGSCSGAATSNSGGALVYVQFVVERPQTYITYPTLATGNFGSARTLAFLANLMSEDIAVVALLPGATSSGRLAPGSYAFYFTNYYRDEVEDGNTTSASIQVGFSEVPNPLVTQHPQNQSVAAGASTSFTVGASEPGAARALAPQALSYQWRRRYQNLADGGRISGATTNQLQIANVAVADSGVYDCVVTWGTVQEPSSLARLTVTSTGAVDDALARSGLSLSRPAPSPFTTRTQLRFTLAAENVVELDVLDVGGRRVRSLLGPGRFAAGGHAIEWDGLDDRGERSPSGMYFVRLVAGAEQRVQRVVRIAE